MCRSWIDAGGSRARLGSARAVFVAVVLTLCGWSAPAAAAQFGALVSPGPLARAHQELEGAGKCQSCHEVGRKTTPARCLSCHKPIAERIAKGSGVHRNAKECVSCHVEHAGVDAELRHFDTKTFNHVVETGFVLDGRHATLAGRCSACHTSRSFLAARPTCSSCHADAHKGQLGTNCATCHATAVAFKSTRTRFDHGTARFALTGAHTQVACESCHKSGVFRGLAFASCASCHAEPHRKKFGAVCTSCHTTEAWTTRSVEHAKTGFPLAGAHAQVACVKCHQGSMTKPLRADQCSSCHTDVHKGTMSGDCRQCHTEKTFAGAAFDHAAKTKFALVGKHTALACRTCHTTISAGAVSLAKKAVDFSGLGRDCVACHGDTEPHTGEFGRRCESCHTPETFNARTFKHPRAPDFHGGQHEVVRCELCHVPGKRLQPVRSSSPTAAVMASAGAAETGGAPSMECGSCHSDVHLGQVGMACERCHTVGAAKFAPAAFVHETTSFPLTGRHRTLECVACHQKETRPFPSGTGTAVKLSGLDGQCRSCHKDPHLGQVDQRCDTCHQTASFKIASFVHTGMEDFFNGNHAKYACRDCHKQETGPFPAGRGTAIRFRVGRTCANCHPGF